MKFLVALLEFFVLFLSEFIKDLVPNCLVFYDFAIGRVESAFLSELVVKPLDSVGRRVTVFIIFNAVGFLGRGRWWGWWRKKPGVQHLTKSGDKVDCIDDIDSIFHMLLL
jgi:hypothetical protein